ncbi:unnamed protein product [Effrenium voratum]|uniref:RING-type domain-containing protein n=1 Tax=Effrenium voratum TaxID=2562239 RepID=A0AA36J2C1_9DINO|nr:unnamed protein product [Effrenium voratum]CAJ1426637.1 unnamed protein product [Effrenium voratum]
MADTRLFRYTWGDEGLGQALLNALRWSRQMVAWQLAVELEAAKDDPRAVRLEMRTEDECLDWQFASATATLDWLMRSFPEEAKRRPPPPASYSLFPFPSLSTCITTTAQDDHELEVTERPPEAPPMEAQEPTPEADEYDPSSLLAEEDIQAKYMWADARVLPFTRDLAQRNPLRWSSRLRPEALARQLAQQKEIRPVQLEADCAKGIYQRRFQSPQSCVHWLRKSFLHDLDRLDEERLCIICLTEPRTVMLMPCRHAVLCEGCLEILLQQRNCSCPVCRKRIQNHALGQFVNDFVDRRDAAMLTLARSQAEVYKGMYNHVRPLMVTGALLASGAAASFVVAPVFAPALLTSAAVIGYLPWFATTVAQFEEEDIGEQTRMFTEEDMCSPLRCALKGAVILVAAPVAAVVFFIPYGLYAGVVRPLARLTCQGLVNGACMLHVYCLRPAARLLAHLGAELWDGAVACGNFLADITGAAAQTFYDWVLAPVGSGLRWCGRQLVNGAQVLHEQMLLPLWHGATSAAEWTYHNILLPSAQCTWSGLKAAGGFVADCAVGLYSHVLAPAATTIGEALKAAGNLMASGAEHLYGYVLRPLAEAVYRYLLLPSGRALQALAYATADAISRLASGLANGAVACYGYVLVPTWNAIASAARSLAYGVAEAAAACYGYVLVPTFNAGKSLLLGIGYGVASAASMAYHYAIAPIGRGLAWSASAIGHGVAAAAVACYECVLLPVLNAGRIVVVSIASGVATAASLTYEHAILPLASAVCAAGHGTYCYIILPCGRAVVHSASVASGMVMAAGSVMVHVTVSAGNEIYVQVLVPAGQASRACGAAVGAAFLQCRAAAAATGHTVRATFRQILRA